MRFVVLTAIALAVCACGSGDVDESTQQSFLLDPGPSGPPPVDAPELVLVDITAWSGLNIPGKGDRGMSFLDADGDGVDDVALVGTDQTTILRGRGDGSFYPYWVTEHPGVTGTYPYVVDITEDGSDDIVLMAETGAHLLAGRGDGAFDYVGEIVGAPNLLAAVASYGDYNGDGRMDFYVGFQSLMGDADSLFGDPDACNFTGEDESNEQPVARDWLYLAGPEGWLDGTAGTGLVEGQYTQAVMSADIDDDGRLDLLVGTEGFRVDQVWMGQAEGGFSERSMQSGMTLVTSAMGYDAVDVDFDGDLDIYVTDEHVETGDKLYIQTAPGVYEHQGLERGLGVTREYTGWGLGFNDMDHDGDFDLFVVNGLPLGGCPGGDEENLMFWGTSEGTFERVAAPSESGLGLVYNSRTAVFSDIDLDGDLDVLVSNINEPPTLLRNDAPKQGDWLQLLLVHPTLSPPVGTKILVSAGGKTHRRDIHGTPSYGGTSTRWIHVGLGDVDQVDSIVIRWPDGTEEQHGPVAANQRLTFNKAQ